MKQALALGVNVVSINRSGKPSDFAIENFPSKNEAVVVWHQADVFDDKKWIEEAKGCDGAISCLGTFGSNEVHANEIYNTFV